MDSNFFRHLLTIENFKILKAPYYQPMLNSDYSTDPFEFNLAIKAMNNGLSSKTVMNKNFYMQLIQDIYNNHYKAWYNKFKDNNIVEEHLDMLINRIEKEYPKELLIEDITLVNCKLFEQGLCRQVDIENITLARNRRRTFKQLFKGLLILLFASITFYLCCIGYEKRYILVVSAFLTIISAVISIIEWLKR